MTVNPFFRAFVQSACSLIIAVALLPSVHCGYADNSARLIKVPVDKERLRQDVKNLPFNTFQKRAASAAGVAGRLEAVVISVNLNQSVIYMRCGQKHY